MVPNKPTTIAKPNFQGAAHNIILKGASTHWYTCKSKITAKARKPNHVFQSRVGLSTHINTLSTQVWAYFLSRKRPTCRATRVVAYERVDCIRSRKKTERKTVVVCSCEVWGKKTSAYLISTFNAFQWRVQSTGNASRDDFSSLGWRYWSQSSDLLNFYPFHLHGSAPLNISRCREPTNSSHKYLRVRTLKLKLKTPKMRRGTELEPWKGTWGLCII